MACERSKGILVALACGASLLAWQAQAQVQANDPHRAVSNDGVVTSRRLAPPSGRPAGMDGFEGTGEVGFDDGMDPSELLSGRDVWDLWRLKPATGHVGVESVIGEDNRVMVNPTTTYPARAVALITFDGGRCTGWLYGPDVVATAGHCVHSGGSGGAWRTNVRVFPGRNGASSPFGSCGARRLHSVLGWTNDANEEFDYGVIKLDCSIGNTVGWFGYWWQSASLNGLSSVVSGYPGDKPLEQWLSTDFIRFTSGRQVFYANDTVGGNSGGPVYSDRPAGSPFCSGICAMGIHAYGLHGISIPFLPPHATNNHGTRIVEPVFNNLQAWRAAP